jgi:hypothetical protein
MALTGPLYGGLSVGLAAELLLGASDVETSAARHYTGRVGAMLSL